MKIFTVSSMLVCIFQYEAPKDELSRKEVEKRKYCIGIGKIKEPCKKQEDWDEVDDVKKKQRESANSPSFKNTS